MMKQTNINVSLPEIEAEARRLQAEAVAAMFSAIATRVRAIFAGAPMNTGTGRIA